MAKDIRSLIAAGDFASLEHLARSEPSQALADALAEAESSADKQAAKALRRAIYLVGLKGFHPAAVEATKSEAVPGKWEKGLIQTSDPNGRTLVTYATLDGDKVRWLYANLHATGGVVEAREGSSPKADGEERYNRMRTGHNGIMILAEIEPEYALSRIATAMRTGKHNPPVLATWRGILDAVKEVPHPAKALKAKVKVTEEERIRLPMEVQPAWGWRLEIGQAAPVLKEVYDAHKDSGETDPDKRREITRTVARKHLAKLFTPEVTRDYSSRLYDLTLAMHTREMEGWERALSAAEDVEKRGAESDFALGLMDKTLGMLVDALRQNQAAGVEA